jgi:HK97 gp10 family phage protein
MTRWRVKRNDFPKVVEAMGRKIPDGVTRTGTEMQEHLQPIIWIDTGVLLGTTRVDSTGRTSVQVAVGWNTGVGFYAAYQEFGTSRQRARPIVGPTAMLFEPRFAKIMADVVREACRV